MAKLPGAVAGARIVGEKFVHSRRGENPDGRMPLLDHLRELRNRVVKIALAIVAGGIVGIVFFWPIWNFLQKPYCRAVGYCKKNVPGHSLVINGVMDGFYLHLKVGIVVGAILTSPFWLYQLWAFVAPGLYAREKRWTYAFLGSAVPLLGLGVFFAIMAMNRGLQFFLGMSSGFTVLYTADTYLAYYIAMIIGFGLCFEVPLFLVMLNLTRVITHERFKKWRRVIIFLVFVFAGIASPSPDPMTMLLLGGVVVVLVEAAEVLIYLNDKRYARNHPDMYTDLSDDTLSPIEPVSAETPVDSSLN
jgi:sec-independent protein translocase protein TatC